MAWHGDMAHSAGHGQSWMFLVLVIRRPFPKGCHLSGGDGRQAGATNITDYYLRSVEDCVSSLTCITNMSARPGYGSLTGLARVRKMLSRRRPSIVRANRTEKKEKSEEYMYIV